MTRHLLSISFVVCLFCASPLFAASGNFRDAKQVRKSTDSIFNSPEFRHLRGLIKKNSPNGNSSEGNGSGNGGSSGGSGGAGNGASGNGSGGSSNGSGGTGSGNGDGNSGSGQGNSSGSQGTGGNGQSGNGNGTGNGSGGTGTGNGGNGNGGNGNGGNGSGGNGSGSGGNGNDSGNGGNNNAGGGNSAPTPATPPSSPNNDVRVPSSTASAAMSGIGTLITGIFWIVIAAVALAMIYFIVKAFLDRDTSEDIKDEKSLAVSDMPEEEPERPPGEIPADVYITRARELAAQGLYNEAVAQLLLGAMSKIERAGLIKYRRGLTNRDYMRAIRSKQGPHQAFRLIVRTYEPIGFGRRNAKASHFEKSLLGYEQGFQSVLEST